MMATHNDMDDVTAYRPASSYGIPKLDCEYLARMCYTDHGVTFMTGGEVDIPIMNNLKG